MSTYRAPEYIKKGVLRCFTEIDKTLNNLMDITFVDNDRLLVYQTKGIIASWNIKKGVQLWKQEPMHHISNVTVPFRDTDIFAYSDGYYNIRTCNVNTGESKKEIEVNDPNESMCEIIGLDFRDSVILVSGNTLETIKFWDVYAQEQLRCLRQETRVYGGTSLVHSPSEDIIACGRCDGSVRLIYLTSKSTHQIKTLEYRSLGSRLRFWAVSSRLSNYRVTKLAFITPQGDLLAVGHGDGNVVLWNMFTQGKKHTLQGRITEKGDSKQYYPITALAFSPDGTHLASAQDFSRNILLWKIDDGENFGILRSDVFVSSFAFSPDGRMLASVGGHSSSEITLWERTD